MLFNGYDRSNSITTKINPTSSQAGDDFITNYNLNTGGCQSPSFFGQTPNSGNSGQNMYN
jgi:hypothetical protein